MLLLVVSVSHDFTVGQRLFQLGDVLRRQAGATGKGQVLKRREAANTRERFVCDSETSAEREFS